METAAPRPSVWAPEWRTLTIGLVVTITLAASEALAVATVLPLVARDLHGISLYGWVTSAFFLGTLVGLVVAGEQVDRHGPAGPFAAGIVVFAAGLLVSGLAPAALAQRSWLAVPLGVAAILVAARPLTRLVPAGTLTAKPGLPATILARGLLTFAFFGADTFVPLAVVSVRHRSTAVAGIALTAATVSWTAA